MLFGLNHSLKARVMKKKINWNAMLPKHIAIMMDGNGRWATQRGLPRTAGHFAGMKTMKNTIRFCKKNNVEYLTLYAFSTENWKRPRSEVDYIISLINEFVTDDTLDDLNRNNIRINFIGDISRFSLETQNMMNNAAALTKSNTDMIVNFAVNYGGRNEIVHAMKLFLKDGSHELSEEEFERFLYTSECPYPELIIRTSGEKRLSGFLLWQSAMSELWFTDEMWPSFNEYLFYKAIYEFQCRKQYA
ncbi:isoprenyl transferase [Paenibacillus baekrokdamisoli]|uniref:Isoprenyl transferase n=1 Tax=Paenibacillus baekrokdamisoli TaxID=1712516 RepID=A0A3G9JAF2_9BACL|nr:polyprenyl diphosphate synthase [Paenibacillus baekrokdamisoli]MBB3070628.1 undecaprenyl diphosphate synthase [Paenibacillus baekrokdamisoli]BBH19979.1 isoprenyl transferase [Paenibacillus baekrokdamisoli]